MNASYLDEKGESSPSSWAATASASRAWSRRRSSSTTTTTASSGRSAIAPYQVHVVQLGDEPEVRRRSRARSSASSKRAGIEVLFDDRDERPGVKFKDADLLGIPLRVTIGAKALKSGNVELKPRTRTRPEEGRARAARARCRARRRARAAGAGALEPRARARMSATQRHRRTTSTDAVHAGIERSAPHHTLTPAIAQTATYTFDDTAELERYMRGEDPDPEREEYGRYGNPTVRELERRVAALEGAEDARRVRERHGRDHARRSSRSQGRRSRRAVSRLLPAHAAVRDQTLARFGVEHTLVDAGRPGRARARDPAEHPARRSASRRPTPISPASISRSCRAIVRGARRHSRRSSTRRSRRRSTAGRSASASTWWSTAPPSTSPATTTCSAAWWPARSSSSRCLRDARHVLGGVLDPHAAFLIGRGLKTLGAARRAPERDGARDRPRARRPSRGRARLLPRAREPPVARRRARADARLRRRGELHRARAAAPAASRVVDRCKLAAIAPSLGGVETLIEQPAIMSYFELSAEELAKVGIDPALMRLASASRRRPTWSRAS